jgi:DNA-binding NtrC family response regulator
LKGPGSLVLVNVSKASETLLLVEDESSVRMLAKRILERAGYRVFEASDGDAAEILFGEHSAAIDMVVSDVIMPGCGGPELLARLRARMPELKVLYMSGYPPRSSAHKAGIDDDGAFLQKPFTPAELARRVRETLDA